MNIPRPVTIAWDSTLEPFAAELTEAAYPIALRHGAHQHWLNLQLNLWYALALTVQKWNWLPASERHSGQSEDFLAELTDAAYHTILCFGMRGSFLEIELKLHETLGTILAAKTREPLARRRDQQDRPGDR